MAKVRILKDWRDHKAGVYVELSAADVKEGKQSGHVDEKAVDPADAKPDPAKA